MRYYKGRIKNLRVEPKSLDWVAAATLWVLTILIVGCSWLWLLPQWYAMVGSIHAVVDLGLSAYGTLSASATNCLIALQALVEDYFRRVGNWSTSNFAYWCEAAAGGVCACLFPGISAHAALTLWPGGLGTE
jgi:hypothetical protein